MASKLSALSLVIRALVLCSLYFASFTASLYFPSSSVWWRVAMIALLAFQTWSVAQEYRRRMKFKREARTSQWYVEQEADTSLRSG